MPVKGIRQSGADVRTPRVRLRHEDLGVGQARAKGSEWGSRRLPTDAGGRKAYIRAWGYCRNNALRP